MPTKSIMTKTISEFVGVDSDIFEATGAFDAILEVDSKFYIDPALLKNSNAPEIVASYGHLQTRFSGILKLLSLSKGTGDAFWRQANRLLTTRELKGLCIGYSVSSTTGSGMGPHFRKKILNTAKEIVDAGVNDPSIFGLIGILEEGIGCDRISDMVGRIIAEDILIYSHRVYKYLNVKTREIPYDEKTYQLPVNPHNKWPILLLPMDILRPLPVARSYDDIDMVCEYNRRIRLRVNRIIGTSWKKATTAQKKKTLRQALLSDKDLLKDFVKDYTAEPPEAYNFEKDPLGEIKWHKTARRFVRQNPLTLKLGVTPSPEELLEIVLTICEKFRDLIENSGLHELLYESPRKPKRESAAQKLFLGIADSYCQANDLDLSPEVNSGRGSVDFKVSRGYKCRVLTELKLTTHKQLKHGFESQLPEYQKAEKTDFSVFLVIHVLTGSTKRIPEIKKIIAEAKKKGERTPELIIVQALPKPSASKYLKKK